MMLMSVCCPVVVVVAVGVGVEVLIRLFLSRHPTLVLQRVVHLYHHHKYFDEVLQ